MKKPEKTKEQRIKEIQDIIESINAGRDLEQVQKMHRNELKKYHNHEGE